MPSANSASSENMQVPVGEFDRVGGSALALRVPHHVAIIMDGNGRWARGRNLPRTEGHREGAESVRAVVREARRRGVGWLTLFAFSEQNWERPAQEVGALMQLLYKYVLQEQGEIMDNGIRLRAIGDISRLPRFVQAALRALMSLSERNTGMTLCLALSYGGREDIAQAARQLSREVAAGTLRADEVTEEAVACRLWSSGVPDVDLLIRTSGEVRISNFLLWQVAYAELYFSDHMWPEFRREQFVQALTVYQQRERRYGLTSEQLLPSEQHDAEQHDAEQHDAEQHDAEQHDAEQHDAEQHSDRPVVSSGAP